jgi:hypothetical protein
MDVTQLKLRRNCLLRQIKRLRTEAKPEKKAFIVILNYQTPARIEYDKIRNWGLTYVKLDIPTSNPKTENVHLEDIGVDRKALIV